MQSLVLKALEKSTNSNKTTRVYSDIIQNITVFNKPSTFVSRCMNQFATFPVANGVEDEGQSIKSIKGKFFEYVIGECFIRKNIKPIYYQANLQYARINKFDWLLYNRNTPVLISCKTSLGERWIITAWEASEMKRIYPQGQCFLITISDQTESKNKLLSEMPNSIDKIIDARTTNFDDLLVKLSQSKFEIAMKESPISSYSKLCQ